ncbi:MAG: antibiotic biosynthesis monooxygenase [Leeuwenhoekiella sp.]|nr:MULTISPECIES: antibiotic biosynthesis monooxygenase family protein [unclassified Leeuwenhoekiella]MAW94600.1 antibiotic biosynthesis monooxygenase [Leeuwenhoekiella sp.]MBA82023.1 antibiotic biosynthesis monooxygenase [Leeuwenhoekiella sp.]|tara:strand:- start:3739 stop:4062 length:324 start_codon:yes stop_codon:yes gene_type:complete
MIIRIVKLTFRPAEVASFLELFANAKKTIRSTPGCNHLELLRDTSNPSIFFTHSHWEQTEDLEAYRKSDFFKKTWSQTKVLFAEKPEAWSLEKFVNLPESTSDKVDY